MRALASLIVLFSWIVGPVSAQPAPAEIETISPEKITPIVPLKEPEATQETRAEQTLLEHLCTQKVDVHFKKTSVKDALHELERQGGIPILIDQIALAEGGFSADRQVTANLPNVSLYTALKWTLHDAELTFVPEADSVWVTTSVAAEKMLKPRYYAVPTLISNENDAEQLIELFTTVIKPESWEDLGGPGSVAPYRSGLMVTQNAHVHMLLERLFAGLESLQKLPSDNYPTACYPISLTSSRQQELLQKLYTTNAKLPVDSSSLMSLIEKLREQVPCPIYLDRRALEDHYFYPDEIISTLPPESFSLARALDVITKSADFTWYVSDELIVITTADEAEMALDVALYPVRDLAWMGLDIQDVRLEEVAIPRPARQFAFGGGWVGYDSLEVDPIFGLPDYKGLIDLLTTTIEPDTWEDLGGAGSIAPFQRRADCLAIAQTQSAHRKLRQGLESLREKQQPANVDQLLEQYRANLKKMVVHTYVAAAGPHGGYRFRKDELQRIIEKIPQRVRPESWDGSTTFVDLMNEKIIVRNRGDVQREIQTYLTDLGIIKCDISRAGSCGCFLPFEDPQTETSPPATTTGQPTPAVR
ncbi:hypothetical protein [Blastopirellula marina]|uniref:Uncharacterized protein n=1 Tax=Blastopirellula marina TaxID=124 RepID=A0A2S8FCT0_9BACT|nr:hypothetical protein [Blastopirellula marina]PQO29968.1 hypothetical protein C5Y98_22160 [Blastopirellula marina]PTL42436.1 hypothetical protein C5Y97_22170 [Blastopirellula marina]